MAGKEKRLAAIGMRGAVHLRSRGDKTPLELFLRGLAAWDTALRRRMDDSKSKQDYPLRFAAITRLAVIT